MEPMIEKNLEKALTAFAKRAPFKPFLVELVSGNRFTIDHPEALAMRGPIAVFIDPDGQYTLFDASSVSQISESFDQMSASA